MLISLQMVSRPDGRAIDPTIRRFPGPQVTIGRAPECQLVLPDELRIVSRHHARIDLRGDAPSLACLSNTAPVRVNGVSVEPGVAALLRGGDVIHVGGFEMCVGVDPAVGVPAAGAAPLRRARLDEWFDLPSATETMTAQPPIDPLDLSAREAPADPRIVVSWRKASPPAAAPSTHPAADRPPMRTPTQADHSAGISPLESTPKPTTRSSAPQAGPSSPASPALPESCDLPIELGDDSAALLRAFARGAGLESVAGEDGAPALEASLLTPQWMHGIGALLAASVEGTLELLRSRATVKREMRAEMTVISRRQNNPLKFAPDALSALAHLVAGRRAAGFLEPVAAVQDAHRDLLAHQLAVMAGMRAALFELVAQLGPEALAHEQGTAGPLAQLVPQLHDAAMWRRYRQHHAELTSRLDSDFEAVFGREFTKAYEAQTLRLRDAGEAKGGT